MKDEPDQGRPGTAGCTGAALLGVGLLGILVACIEFLGGNLPGGFVMLMFGLVTFALHRLLDLVEDILHRIDRIEKNLEQDRKGKHKEEA